MGVREKVNFDEREVADPNQNANLRNDLMKKAADGVVENIDI